MSETTRQTMNGKPVFTVPEYRPIPDHKGYVACNDGSVWSLWKRTRIGGKPSGTICTIGQSMRLLKPVAYTGGYLAVNLRGRKVYVHRAVLHSFLGKEKNGQVARHLDGNPKNNRLENLEWSTQKENIFDKIRHGTVASGERNGFSKLNQKDVAEIRRQASEGRSKVLIAGQFGICREHVYRITKGQLWKT